MEQYKSLEYSSPLFQRITRLRTKSNESTEIDIAFTDAVYRFNNQLKRDVADAGLDGNFHAIPEWHKLVGSTPEYAEMDEESRTFILGRIAEFVSVWEERVEDTNPGDEGHF